jgi:hypothetical protein
MKRDIISGLIVNPNINNYSLNISFFISLYLTDMVLIIWYISLPQNIKYNFILFLLFHIIQSKMQRINKPIDITTALYSINKALANNFIVAIYRPEVY